ncbi:MAG: 16S rRNA (guanine(966)-N(2))-methyltransferase RsmD [Candidatus Eisenbacteria bacterium]
MRIVAGQWRGRALDSPAGLEHRPTQERVREAVFDALGARLPGARVVDLYAGSGAMGLEALSRGAAGAVFVEAAPAALGALEENIRTLGAAGLCRVVACDVFAFLEGRAGSDVEVDLLFADPPYGTIDEAWLSRVVGASAIRWRAHATLVLESSRREAPLHPHSGWRRWRDRSYGETRILIDVRESHDAED